MRSRYASKDVHVLVRSGDAISEARALLPLLEGGASVDEIRDLITISSREVRVLVQIESNLTAMRSIQQRIEIAREFEALIAGGLGEDVRKCPQNSAAGR